VCGVTCNCGVAYSTRIKQYATVLQCVVTISIHFCFCKVPTRMIIELDEMRLTPHPIDRPPRNPQVFPVCCSVLQCLAVFCSVLQCVAGCHVVLQGVAVCCSVLQCVAVCCSVLQ